MPGNTDRIRALLKSIETGDPAGVSVVNEARYIQHNPQTREGSEGLAALFKRLSETSPRVNVVRAFEAQMLAQQQPAPVATYAPPAYQPVRYRPVYRPVNYQPLTQMYLRR